MTGIRAEILVVGDVHGHWTHEDRRFLQQGSQKPLIAAVEGVGLSALPRRDLYKDAVNYKRESSK